MKRILILIAVLVVLAISASAIYAQGPGNGRGPGKGPRGGHLIEAIATATTVDAVIEARQNGQSFNDYITANGGEPAEVLATVLADAEERLATAVENGRLTQEEADARLAEHEARLIEVMADTSELHVRGGYGRGGQVIETIAEALELDAQDVRDLVQDGATLAEVITDNGGDVDAVRATLVQELTDAINQQVTDGKIDQARADELIAELETRVDDLLNGELPLRGDGGRGGRA